MGDKQDVLPQGKEHTIVELQMAPEDVQRANQAFKDGILAELGITSIQIAPTSEAHGKWTKAEKANSIASPNGTPPLP